MVRSRRLLNRRGLIALGAGMAGSAFLAACGSGDEKKTETTKATAAPQSTQAAAAVTTAPTQAQVNAKGWPTKYAKLTVANTPLEDKTAQLGALKPLDEHVSAQLGVPVETSITTSYAALVQAQKNNQVMLGYYGPLSFLLAEQQFKAVPILIDSADGTKPGSYTSILIAGKDSGITKVADLKGKDFAFVDPASTSGNLVPRSMLLEENIDPNKDLKGRFAGNHANAILAVAKGQVPAGGTNNVSLEQAIARGTIQKDDVVVLKTSAPIPNGPYAVSPDFDPVATKKLQEAYGGFKDLAALKVIGLTGVLIPVDTAIYDPIRRLARLLDLKFDEKGNAVPVGGN